MREIMHKVSILLEKLSWPGFDIMSCEYDHTHMHSQLLLCCLPHLFLQLDCFCIGGSSMKNNILSNIDATSVEDGKLIKERNIICLRCYRCCKGFQHGSWVRQTVYNLAISLIVTTLWIITRTIIIWNVKFLA